MSTSVGSGLIVKSDSNEIEPSPVEFNKRESNSLSILDPKAIGEPCTSRTSGAADQQILRGIKDWTFKESYFNAINSSSPETTTSTSTHINLKEAAT